MKQLAQSIKAVTPASLRKSIHKVGKFLESGLSPNYPSVEASLDILKRSGFSPGFCVDVGAYTGEWATMFTSIFPSSKILMVEAQEGKRSQLEQIARDSAGRISLEIALLGPSDGKEVEFVEMETGSSVFEESSDCVRKKEKRTTHRLDTILSSNHSPVVDFLKLDVQGYELQVLEGAATTLAQATAVLMEASFIPINKGCPLIMDVMTYMDAADFILFDFCSQIRREDGALWQTDLLFLKKGCAFLPKAFL